MPTVRNQHALTRRIDPAGYFPLDDVRDAAQKACSNREAPVSGMGCSPGDSSKNNNDFERVLSNGREVNDMGLEVCATLGMLTPEQATHLKKRALRHTTIILIPAEEHMVTSSPPVPTRTGLKPFHMFRKARISCVLRGDYLVLGEPMRTEFPCFITPRNAGRASGTSVPVNARIAE